MRKVLMTIAAVVLSGPALAETGVASVYGNGDGHAGKCVAEQSPRGGCLKMNPRAMSAAHRTLRFGSMVEVTNRNNGRRIVVRINDRGPFVRGRVIDLSPAGAAGLGFSGLAPVSLRVL